VYKRQIDGRDLEVRKKKKISKALTYALLAGHTTEKAIALLADAWSRSQLQ